MAKQQDVMAKAVSDFVSFIKHGDGNDVQKQCGNNLSVAIKRSDVSRDYDEIIMYSYNSPIARVCLSDIDAEGDVKVQLNAFYYNYSVTTSRHLTYFLSALYYALPVSRGMFERRANRKDIEKRAYDAVMAVDIDSRKVWFTL